MLPGAHRGPNRKPGDDQHGGEHEADDDVEGVRRRAQSTPMSPMPGNVHSSANTTAVTASQRHSRKRASANAAAVTTAR